VEPLTTVSFSDGGLLAFPANIRLGWRWLTVTIANAQSYDIALFINTVKSIIVQAPGMAELN
jgi:hypothetical protein